jgi:hypothetical protein
MIKKYLFRVGVAVGVAFGVAKPCFLNRFQAYIRAKK